MAVEKRAFKITKASASFNKTGRYKGKDALAAARHAASRIFMKSKGQSKISLTLEEITRGSDHKEYKYNAKRVKLAKPREIKRKGAEPYKVTHETKVTAA